MTQDTALSILKTGANVFLSGEPGSGKTYTVNTFVSYLKKHGIEPAITASTGIAATHIGGMTIHSWSGIRILKELMPSDINRILANKRTVSRIKKAQTLIIDEISMLDGKTLTLVDQVCKAVRQFAGPFGGMQVVFVGDFFQLPPVSSQSREEAESLFSDEYASPFAFESRAWKQAEPLVCYLSEQHRQSDEKFLELLSAIRAGRINDNHKRDLNDRITDPSASKNITKLFPHNADVDRINSVELAKLPGQATAFPMSNWGHDNLVEQLKRGCLSPEKLELKKGAIVMFTKNSYDRKYVNGTIGTITGFDNKTRYPIVKTLDGRSITAEPAEWGVEEHGVDIAGIKQIPLRLAWAITVHKSQGMSLDSAHIDLGEAFVEGQGYVALSRVRTLDGLFLKAFNDKALMIDPRVSKNDLAFRSASDEAELNFLNLPSKELQKMHEKFVSASGGKKMRDLYSMDPI